ncbi:hypothetical protein [Rheinheimera sp.]|uniref:hypothetical protein n=1 Tax=Rheinheimera sp. TaxID=1869214 RepID=UPI0027B9A575|nr:hypothetical protein [Rheinheimera sp.]
MKQAMMILGFSLFTLAGCGATAEKNAADAATNQPQSVQVEKQEAQTTKTCHAEHRTGSRMAKRTCKS